MGVRDCGIDEVEEGIDIPWEPAGHGLIAKDIVACQEVWHIRVHNSMVTEWMERGYALLWTTAAPALREWKNAQSASLHHEFFSGAQSEVLAENAITRLPMGERPTVASPLEVVPKRGTNKFRLTVNMRFVNRHLEKKVFKFEGLKDLADMVEKGNHMVSYDLMSGFYHVGLHPMSRTFIGFS